MCLCGVVPTETYLYLCEAQKTQQRNNQEKRAQFITSCVCANKWLHGDGHLFKPFRTACACVVHVGASESGIQGRRRTTLTLVFTKRYWKMGFCGEGDCIQRENRVDDFTDSQCPGEQCNEAACFYGGGFGSPVNIFLCEDEEWSEILVSELLDFSLKTPPYQLSITDQGLLLYRFC